MERLSHWVLNHSRLALALTLTLVLAGAGSLGLLLPRITEGNAYPGLPGYEANALIAEHLGTGGYERPYLPVITLPEGLSVTSASGSAALDAAFDSVEQRTGARIASYGNTGDSLFLIDDRTTFAVVAGPPVERGGIPGSALGEDSDLGEQLAEVLRAELPPGSVVAVTGLDSLATGTDAGGLNVAVKLAVTLAAALIVLIWGFRSWLALIPLIVALLALPVSYLALTAISGWVDIHETTLQMVPLLGVGIAVDYALILVSRWREERAAGARDDVESIAAPGSAMRLQPEGGAAGGRGAAAIHAAMRTAGHAVAISALAVAAGLTVMMVLPIPLLRSLAFGGVAVALASALVTALLLPLLLRAAGRRLDRHPARAAAHDQRERRAGRAWTRWAGFIVRHHRAAAATSAVVLLALATVAFSINLHPPTTDRLSPTGPGRDALSTLQSAGVPNGIVSSFDVFVSDPARTDDLASDLADVPGVRSVLAPDDEAWRGTSGAVITVVPEAEGGTTAGAQLIEDVRSTVGSRAMVGGNATQQLDYLDAAYGSFAVMLAILAAVTFVLLALAFRSVLLPLKAIAMNLLSLCAVLGVMVMLWQWGWGTEAAFGLQADGTIGTFVPITIFAFLFGLTMDYEVFILSRIREEYDTTGDTDQAVITGIGRTGRLISAAAAILIFSFASMTTGGELDVTVFASGMAIGLLLDATLIRSVLVPASVVWLGSANWWWPFPRTRSRVD